ncbi:MAG: hypothetical protein ACK4RV_04140 [Caulobacter sp.]
MAGDGKQFGPGGPIVSGGGWRPWSGGGRDLSIGGPGPGALSPAPRARPAPGTTAPAQQPKAAPPPPANRQSAPARTKRKLEDVAAAERPVTTTALTSFVLLAIIAYHGLGRASAFAPFLWDLAREPVSRLPFGELLLAGSGAWAAGPFVPWIITLVLRFQALRLVGKSTTGAVGLAGLALIIDVGAWFMMGLPTDGPFGALAQLLLVEAVVLAGLLAVNRSLRRLT